MGTIAKALALLDLISGMDHDLGLTEIARLGGLDKATARRLLLSMEKYGFIEQDGETRKYRIGAAPVRLARIREARFPFASVAAPILKTLVENVGETVHLSEFSGGRLATVHVEDPRRSHRVMIKAGMIMPFHATASGLAFLAFAPAEEMALALSGPFERYTQHTLTNADAIRAELHETRVRGFSICEQGMEKGVISVGAPVLAPGGRAVGTVAIAAPMARADLAAMHQHGVSVVTAGRAIAERCYALSPVGAPITTL